METSDLKFVKGEYVAFCTHCRAMTFSEDHSALLPLTGGDNYRCPGHEAIGDPTIADAILDRIIHTAHKINLKGESMRKQANPLHQTGHLG